MIKIDIKHDIRETIRLFEDRYRKNFRFATAVTLTGLAKKAQKEAIDTMATRFDRPTPFVMKSMFIKAANKNNLEAMVFLKDIPLPKNQYSIAEMINQQFASGSRVRKRLELWLQRAGYISGTEYVVPGAGAKLDQYGNISRGLIQQLLSQLRAGPDAAQYATKSKRSTANRKRAGEMFWSRGGRLPRGVWMRNDRSLIPILIVVSRVSYKQLINMQMIADKIVAKDFDRDFETNLENALRTAK